MSQRSRRQSLVAAGALTLTLPLLLAVGTSSPAQGAAPSAHKIPVIGRQTAHNTKEGEGPAFQRARDAYMESRRTAGSAPLTAACLSTAPVV